MAEASSVQDGLEDTPQRRDADWPASALDRTSPGPRAGPYYEPAALPDLIETESGSPCPVCRDHAVYQCSGCLSTVYCGRDHQRRHWSSHSAACRPYSVAFHHEMGRHLVAARHIRRGELILRDRPLVMGPCQLTAPLCLGCYRPLPTEDVYRCRRCGWPLCCPQCEDSAHHQPECDVTARSPLGQLKLTGGDWYECVTVLRVLELSETSPAAWTALLALQSHDAERKDSDAYKLEQRTVVERVRNRFGQRQHSELLIHRICGIMDTNAYEIRLPEINIQGIYAEASLFEHTCVPNTHRTFDEDLTLVVRAAVDIPQGAHLTSIYTDNLWGTWQRREHLLESKHFRCCCARCADPTELGTGLSSLRCQRCTPGYLTSDHPLREEAGFTCDTCGAHVEAAHVRTMVSSLQTRAEALEEEPTIESCERFISLGSKVLHPNHFLLLDVSYPLVHLYNSGEPLMARQLQRKEQLCRQLLEVADVLTPGISRLRGILLYELQQTLLQKARKLYKSKKGSNHKAITAVFREALAFLREAVSVLRWEPAVQPEGQLGLEAVEELSQLEGWLRLNAPAALDPEVAAADADGASCAAARLGSDGTRPVAAAGVCRESGEATDLVSVCRERGEATGVVSVCGESDDATGLVSEVTTVADRDELKNADAISGADVVDYALTQPLSADGKTSAECGSPVNAFQNGETAHQSQMFIQPSLESKVSTEFEDNCVVGADRSFNSIIATSDEAAGESGFNVKSPSISKDQSSASVNALTV